MERIVSFTPAYDKRNPDPKKDYGIHGVVLRMVLKGKAGAVQFVLFTNWQLPHVQEEQDNRIISKASRGSTFSEHISSPIAPNLGDVDKLLEGAKRSIGMSSSSSLDKIDLDVIYHPMPADLGYHSLVPLYEGQESITEKCECLDDKPCYYDGSGLNASHVFELMLKDGDTGVWAYLEKYYKDTFKEC